MKQPDLAHPRPDVDPCFEEFCIGKLDSLETLEPGWDFEGGPAIDRDIIEAVRRFVRSVPGGIAPRPMVVPLSSGRVQLEWHAGRRVLELEFESADTVHYLKWDPENQIEDEGLAAAAETSRLIDLIVWFARGGRDD
jgi:hypothetical protein